MHQKGWNIYFLRMVVDELTADRFIFSSLLAFSGPFCPQIRFVNGKTMFFCGGQIDLAQ